MELPFLDEEIVALKEKGRYRFLRRLSTPQDARITIEGKEVLNFSSNNYLGLANHPEVVAALADYAGRYGVGSGASRLISGHMDVHAELEEAMARFKGSEGCLTFSAGYMANLGILSTLGSPDTTIFSDEWNHASIVDGCLLSRARVEVYRHTDVTHLEDLLRASSSRRKIVVTDGVFSMDGDIAPLPDLVTVKDRYGAILVVDDAHAVGVLPPRGRGSGDHFGLSGRVEILMGHSPRRWARTARTCAPRGAWSSTSSTNAAPSSSTPVFPRRSREQRLPLLESLPGSQDASKPCGRTGGCFGMKWKRGEGKPGRTPPSCRFWWGPTGTRWRYPGRCSTGGCSFTGSVPPRCRRERGVCA